MTSSALSQLSAFLESAYVLVDSGEPIAVIVLKRSSIIEFKVSSTSGNELVTQLLLVLHVPPSCSLVSDFLPGLTLSGETDREINVPPSHVSQVKTSTKQEKMTGEVAYTGTSSRLLMFFSPE